jgi:hypothetical protein
MLPPNILAGKFWSFTVYDNQTRSMLDTLQRYPRAAPELSRRPPKPADRSTTVYFSPIKPDGANAGTVQTDPKKGWFTILRLYSPLEPFFTKEWRPVRSSWSLDSLDLVHTRPDQEEVSTTVNAHAGMTGAVATPTEVGAKHIRWGLDCSSSGS